MVKKIVTGIVAFSIFLVVNAAGYLYFISAKLLEEVPAVTSSLYDAQFSSSVGTAED